MLHQREIIVLFIILFKHYLVPQGTEKTGVYFSRPRLRRQGLRTLHLKAASKNVIIERLTSPTKQIQTTQQTPTVMFTF